MNNLKTKTKRSLKTRVANLTHLFTPLTFLLLTSACSSTCPTHSDMRLVLEEENALLNAVSEERAEKTLVSRIKKDNVLSRAEARLKKVIRALIESNKTLQTGF